MYRLVASFVIGLCFATNLYAQEASLIGTVTDETKAILPGAAIPATELTAGRQFAGVTDERGQYRLAGMTAGRSRLQAELDGFTTVVVPEIELLRVLPIRPAQCCRLHRMAHSP